jgi:hypothetical protein
MTTPRRVSGFAIVLLLLGSGGARADGVLASAPEPVSDSADRDVERDQARRETVRFGGLIGLGFPRPLAIEAMLKLQRLVGLGVEYSLLPETTISGIDTSFWAIAADLRVFPFRNGFFFGLRAGSQRLSGEATVLVAGQTLTESTAVQTMFVNPRIGFLWTWNAGFSLGLDAGLQIPVSNRTTGALAEVEGTTLPPQAAPIEAELRSVADYLGRSTIPTLDLIRVGLLL